MLRAAWGMTVLAVGSLCLALVPKAAVLALVFGPLWGVVAWRLWLAGVRVRSDGVRVNGYLFSTWVPWSEIERFTVESAGPYPYVGRLIRKDGKPPVILVGTGTGTRKTEYNRVTAEKPIDLLNKRLEEWRAAQARGAPGRLSG
jgi:hypothetical protein